MYPFLLSTERLSFRSHFLGSRRDTSKGTHLYRSRLVTTSRYYRLMVAARSTVYPILRPFSTVQVQKLMKSVVIRVTTLPRILSLMNLKSRGGDILSTVFAGVTPLSTFRFSRNLLRHSAENGRSGGKRLLRYA